MLLSYWDAGYVKLDVTDPVHPTYLADSDFTFPDPELKQQTGRLETPEGNGHEAEFTHDGQHIIAADEDFNPTRVNLRSDDGTTGRAVQAGAAQLPTDGSLTAKAIHVGVACDPATVPAPPATGGPYLAAVERGVCTFTQKAATVEAVTANGGYAGTVVFNRTGAGGCGALVSPAVVATKPFFFINRPTGLGLFDADAGYNEAACLALPADGSVGRGPVPIGTVGDTITLTAAFDGWGYVHLFANNNGKLRELDTFGVPEAMDPAHATGFGALSVHEVATSHCNPHLAYLSYYDAGLRVIEIQHNKLVEVGRFIDEGGNDFWGVQVFSRDGVEYVAASDRDFGVYIFRFTGHD